MVEYCHARRAETLMSLRRKRSPPSPRGPGQPSGAAFRCTADNWFAEINPRPATPKPSMACDPKRKPTQLAGAPARSGTMRRCASTPAPASCKRSSEGTVLVGLSGPRSLGSTSWWRVRNACMGETLCSSSLFPGWRTVTTAPPNTVFEQAHVCAVFIRKEGASHETMRQHGDMYNER